MTEKIIPFFNPATGEQFGEVKAATPDEVMAAREELRQLAPVWGQKPVRERVRIIKKLQRVLLEHTDYITETVTRDTGKSRQDALIEVFVTVEKIHTYCKKAPRWLRRRRVSPGMYVFKQYFTEP
ncbi:MAG: aldehyde dehydrogenase family protein, partial [Anaerolineales bacterium]|nr:aldehyde dehydrogenase family protein [Anaerolineales bacterium]